MKKNFISCLIVNLNCLNYTINLVNNIREQNYKNFDVVIVDQNSIEYGTKIFLDSFIGNSKFKVIRNTWNRPLNHIWNDFALNANGEYLAFLNNDITIPPNFLLDIATIFDAEAQVSCVVHPTNHPDWRYYNPNQTSYELVSEPFRQGWDFAIRARDWQPIPEILEFYCGDDYIFEKIYQIGKRVAMATSSPIIHWLSQTRKSSLNKIIPNRSPHRDMEKYKELGLKHYLGLIDKYSKIAPTFQTILRKE